MKKSFKLIFLVVFLLELWLQTTQSADSAPKTMSWAQFKQTYKKKFPNTKAEDKSKRTFEANMKYVIAYNKWAVKKKLSSRLGVNSHFDTIERPPKSSFSQKSKKIVGSKGRYAFPRVGNSKYIVNVPTNFDYRGNGSITAVGDQGDCDADWAFAGITVYQTRYVMARGAVAKDLSVQYALDCAGSDANSAAQCNGGSAYDVLDDSANYGTAFVDEFPYIGAAGKCISSDKITDELDGYSTFFYPNPAGTGAARIKEEIYYNGPLVASFVASYDYLFYASGLFVDSNCQDPINRFFIAIVGWSVTSDRLEFWNGKASFGTSWGFSGYIKLPIKPDFKYCDNTMQLVGIDLYGAKGSD